MPKYSTGGGGRINDGGDSCELCGAVGEKLTETTIAGATLRVCSECEPHSDTPSRSGSEENTDDAERKRRAARRMAELQDAQRGDVHWAERGTNYDDDPLPYLISDYNAVVQSARQKEGLQLEELAAEIGVAEQQLLAVEQGRAARAGIGGSVISALEKRFEIDLTE